MVSALSRRLESKMAEKVRWSWQVSSAQARVPCPLCYATRLAERQRGCADPGLGIGGSGVRGRGGKRDNYSSLLPPHSTLCLLVTHPSVQFSCSVVSDFVTPWTAACQASLSITNFWSLFKLMSIESVMPSNHLILCRPLLLLPSIFPSIRVF